MLIVYYFSRHGIKSFDKNKNNRGARANRFDIKIYYNKNIIIFIGEKNITFYYTLGKYLIFNYAIG